MSSITGNGTATATGTGTGSIIYSTPTSTVTPFTGAAAALNAYQGLFTGVFILLASHTALVWM